MCHELKNHSYSVIHPKFKQNFGYKMLDRKLITRNENGTKIVVIMHFTKNSNYLFIY
jgi:hypothetical protein